MRIINLSFLIFFVFMSCNQSTKSDLKDKPVNDSNMTDRSKTDSSFKFVESFKGTLPCADCPGIVTEITFINDNLSYHEKDTYLEKNVTNELKGSYTTDRGYKTDDDATVYVLDDDKPGHERWFLKMNDSTLLMLDGKEEIIDTTSRYRISRIR